MSEYVPGCTTGKMKSPLFKTLVFNSTFVCCSVSLTVAPASVIVFTCNHCPYALAWHDRIAQAARDYRDTGVRFAAINSNDAERYPRDSYEAMRSRVAAEPWPMPYLHDASQAVARAYDAKTTPHVFVLDVERRPKLIDRALNRRASITPQQLDDRGAPHMSRLSNPDPVKS